MMLTRGVEGLTGFTRAVLLLTAVVACAFGYGVRAEAQGAPAPPSFELSGVIIVEEGVRWALLSEPPFRQAIMVRLGGTIGDYRLTEVAEDHVILTRPGYLALRIPLSGTGSSVVATGAPPSPPPAETPRAAGGSRSADTIPPSATQAPEPPQSPQAVAPGPPRFDVEDFKRQLQEEMKKGAAR